jgi:hypothetical protein
VRYGAMSGNEFQRINDMFRFHKAPARLSCRVKRANLGGFHAV